MATNIKRKSTAGGGKFSYKYTELATIHEELEAQEITYYQFTQYDEKAGADYIYTVLIKDDKESKPLRGVKIVNGNTLSGGNSAQEYGSALTYARRYSLLMALGWATEDDDAASVGGGQSQSAHQSQGHTDGRLDFDKVKSYLKTLTTVEQVEAAEKATFAKYPKITEKQKNALNRIFVDRKDWITEGEPANWHDADVVPTEEEWKQIN